MFTGDDKQADGSDQAPLKEGSNLYTPNSFKHTYPTTDLLPQSPQISHIPARPEAALPRIAFWRSPGSLVAIVSVFTVLVGYRNVLAIIFWSIIYLAGVLLAIVAFNIGLPYWIQRLKASSIPLQRRKHTSYRMRFSTPAAYSASQIKKAWETSFDWRKERLHPKLEEKSTSAFDRLLMKIMRDFVWQWYDQLVPPPYGKGLVSSAEGSSNSFADTYSSPSFPLAVEKVIRHCIRVILLRLEPLDIPDLVIHKILPILTTHIEAFRQAESDLRGGANIGGGHRSSSRRDSRGGIYGAFFSSGNDEIDLLLARLHADVLKKRNLNAEPNTSTNNGFDGPRPTVRLHPAVDVPTPNSQASEQAHLRQILDKILPMVLPPSEANSRAVKLLVTELLTCSILGPVIDMLSDSDFWNRFIEERAGNVIREQKMVEQLREVLDRQLSLTNMTTVSNTSSHVIGMLSNSDTVTDQPNRGSTTNFNNESSGEFKRSISAENHPSIKEMTVKSADPISVKSSVKDFEKFSRSIHKCNTLFDARRLKNDIETQIRKTEALLYGQINYEEAADPERRHSVPTVVNTSVMSSSVLPRDLVTYLERLQAVRETADHRIAVLGGNGGLINPVKLTDPWGAVHSRQPQAASYGHKPSHVLQAILRDRESPALSYFTEFMDRRQRVNLVQFWLAVDGLKDPLEEELVLEDNSSVKLPGKGHTPNVSSFSSSNTHPGPDNEHNHHKWEAMRDDLKAIAEINLGSVSAMTSLGLKEEDVSPLLQFLSIDPSPHHPDITHAANKPMSQLNNVREAKSRLFNMQQKVFDSMLSEDFPAFAASGDLYLRATASVIFRPPRPDPPSSNTSLSEESSQAQVSAQKPRQLVSPTLSMSPIKSKSKSPPPRFAQLIDYLSDSAGEGESASIGPQSTAHEASKRFHSLVRSNSDEAVLRPSNPLKLLSQYQSFRATDPATSSKKILHPSQSPSLAVSQLQSWKARDRQQTKGAPIAAVLPPQVTLQAAFDERLPSERLTGTTQYSHQTNQPHPSWHAKTQSDPEQVKPFSSTPATSSISQPSNPPISSSLDFLMCPSEGDRAPLFGEEPVDPRHDVARLRPLSNQEEGRSSRSNLSHFPLVTEPSMNMAASIALQEALTSIISTADDGKGADEQRLPIYSTSSDSSARANPPNSSSANKLISTGSSAAESRLAVDQESDKVIVPDTVHLGKNLSNSMPSMPSSSLTRTDHMTQRKGLFDDDDDDDEQDGDSDDWDPRGATYRSSHSHKSNSLVTLRDIAFDYRSEGGRGDRGNSRDDQSSLMITGLSDADERILKLENQLNLLSSLMRRAELTGNKLEIRLVQKSMDSVSRELSEVIYHKMRLIEQKEMEVGGFRAKLVPGRVKVAITGTTIGRSITPSTSTTSSSANRGGNQNLSPVKSGAAYSTMNLATAATGLVTGGPSDVVLYTIEVHKLTEEDGSFGSGWIVTRRYNEFNLLNKALKERYPIARQLEFPAKIIGIGIGISIGTTNSRAMVEQRKLALERYLRALIQIPVLCESPELAGFLSRSKANLPFMLNDSTTSLRRQMELFAGSGFVRSIYKSITSGGISTGDEGERERNQASSPPSMFEAMISGLRQQAQEFAHGFSAGSSAVISSGDQSLALSLTGSSMQKSSVAKEIDDDPLQKSHDEDYDGDPLASLTTNVRPIEGELLTSFTAPICDFLIEIFELNDKNQWLRKQGIVIVLQQILGGTIERKLREAISENSDDEHIAQLIGMLEDCLWEPEVEGGKLKTPPPPRTFEQKIVTRDGAYHKLSAIIPDLAANVLGRSNARRGVRRLFSMCQNRRLNKHLIYTIIDEVLRSLFPEAAI